MTVDLNEEIDVDELIERQKNHREEAKNRPAPPKSVDVDDLEAPVTRKVVEPVQHHTYDAGELPMTKGHHTADPFAPREGKTLVWRDVNMTLVRPHSSALVLICLSLLLLIVLGAGNGT